MVRKSGSVQYRYEKRYRVRTRALSSFLAKVDGDQDFKFAVNVSNKPSSSASSDGSASRKQTNSTSSRNRVLIQTRMSEQRVQPLNRCTYASPTIPGMTRSRADFRQGDLRYYSQTSWHRHGALCPRLKLPTCLDDRDPRALGRQDHSSISHQALPHATPITLSTSLSFRPFTFYWQSTISRFKDRQGFSCVFLPVVNVPRD